jgi:methylmalonyl-CoA mutase
MGNEYMAILTDRGIEPGMAASKIRFSFSIGSNYFFEIARLRAARLLWSVITDKYNPADRASCRMEIHCTTGRWNKTMYDPYVNMLRTQTEAMSATLGGTDSLTVEPFDAAFRKPDRFSERIARNQQLLLKEEAYFDKVADPAGGSYYIEKLTRLIAENAWDLFIETEGNGGFIESLKSGSIQGRIRESAKRKRNDVASRKEILLGTNQYPDLKETKARSVQKSSEAAEDCDLIVEPVRLSRGSEELERLRLAADNAPKRPVVFMLTLGNAAMRRARAQFSCSFFACGGYNVIDNHGFNSPEEGVEEALKAGAAVIVVCSSDEEYELLAPAVFEKIAGRAITVVAGNPDCKERLREAGIEHFIGIKSNLVDTLKEFHRMTGLTS